MPAEREAVRVHGLLVEQRCGNAVREEDAAERRLAGRDALREGDDVGVEAEPLGPEPGAQAAEPGDHLVAPEQDAVAVAQLPQPLRIARRRSETAARVLHRLDDDGRHGVRSLGDDGALDRGNGGVGPLLLGDGLAVVAAVRVLGVADVAEERLERRPRGRDPGQRERAERAAVVGAAAGDHLAPQRLAPAQPMLPHELQRRLDRLRAARREERAGEVLGSQVGDAAGELDRRRRGRRPVGVEAERLELALGRLAQLGAVRVADLGREEAGHRVEEPGAVRLEDVRALASDQDGWSRAVEVRHPRPRQPLPARGLPQSIDALVHRRHLERPPRSDDSGASIAGLRSNLRALLWPARAGNEG